MNTYVQTHNGRHAASDTLCVIYKANSSHTAAPSSGLSMLSISMRASCRSLMWFTPASNLFCLKKRQHFEQTGGMIEQVLDDNHSTKLAQEASNTQPWTDRDTHKREHIRTHIKQCCHQDHNVVSVQLRYEVKIALIFQSDSAISEAQAMLILGVC